jgi:hypothetical protein
MNELVGSFTAFVHHGMLYVQDSKSQDAHLDWNPAEGVGVHEGSIVFPVLPGVDGPVSVEVVRNGVGGELGSEYFDGEIITPSHQVTICDPNQVITMTIPTGATSHLRIYVDDADFPKKITISLIE